MLGLHRDPPLGPSRWRPPRASTTLRGALVAALLTAAVGLLYAAGDGGRPCAARDPGAAGPGPSGPAARRLPAGTVGLPVRLTDPAALAVLRPGDRVDLLALPDTASGDPADGPAADGPAPGGPAADGSASGRPTAGGPAAAGVAREPVIVAPDALVLAVAGGEFAADAALYLAVPPPVARLATGMPRGTRFGVIVRPD